MAFTKTITDTDGKQFRIQYFKNTDNERVVKIESRLNTNSEWENIYEGILEYILPNLFIR